jgi:hypothetical protein
MNTAYEVTSLGLRRIKERKRLDYDRVAGRVSTAHPWNSTSGILGSVVSWEMEYSQ